MTTKRVIGYRVYAHLDDGDDIEHRPVSTSAKLGAADACLIASALCGAASKVARQ